MQRNLQAVRFAGCIEVGAKCSVTLQIINCKLASKPLNALNTQQV